MSELVLHHHDPSPFAEKIRLALGMKGLPWRSVQIPMVMPKPDLMPLTGGYRKTPVLQIGAEVYCDTRLILAELETRFPEPTLFPGGGTGMPLALSRWSDTTFFEPGAGLAMGLNEDLPEPILTDRKAFFNFMDFDELGKDNAHLYGQFLAQVQLVEDQLADGRAFLDGDRPGVTDILAWFPIWMARTNFPQSAPYLQPFAKIEAWERRIADIGYGTRTDIDAEEALEAARVAEPASGAGVAAGDPSGLTAGIEVTVTPTDYGAVPVEGTLVNLDLHRVTVRRSDPRIGEVNTHFPRSGYRVAPA